ncbi:MAG TPA: hypothetical protein VFA11_14870 [Acidimicrobiales bacterium]|nr:hypothetical protein [Acidimicrobiales bacterium]
MDPVTAEPMGPGVDGGGLSDSAPATGFHEPFDGMGYLDLPEDPRPTS